MSDIESAFTAAITKRAINGAILVANNVTGNFTYSRTLGARTLLSGDRVPQRADDVLCLASASKLITTIAALQCVDDGLLSLTSSDLSTTILPELSKKKVLIGYNADDEEIYEDAKEKITLEMLLTHTAGMSYPPSDPNLTRWHAKHHVFQPGNEGTLAVEEAYVYPLGHQPGESWMYGFGVDWAGRAVERVTQKPLLSFMKERIFTPLGIVIQDVAFYPVQDEGIKERQVDRNPDDVEGSGIAVMGAEAAAGQKFLRGAFGGHGLCMTAGDYLKVLNSLLVNDGRLLKTETVDGMFCNRLEGKLGGAVFGSLVRMEDVGVYFRAGVDGERKMGFGLGGMVVLDDIPQDDEDGKGDVEVGKETGKKKWACGKGTLAWGGGYTLAWFVDGSKGICGVGAVCSAIPTDLGEVNSLKDVFRRGVYEEFEEWKSTHGQN